MSAPPKELEYSVIVPEFNKIYISHPLLEKFENLRYTHVQSQIDVYKETLNCLESDAENLRKECSAKEEKVLSQKEKFKVLTDDFESVKNEHKQLKKAFEKLKKENTKLSDDPLTENDRQRLDKCKRKFYLYEQCTKVVFDYSHKETVKGFANNAKTNYLNSFTLEKTSNVERALWTEVSKAGELQCSQHMSQPNGRTISKKV